MSSRRNFIKKSTAFSAAIAALPGLVWSQSSSNLPKVLILGDSISIGYYPFVKEYLAGKADVVRPLKPNGDAENCQGTTFGIANINRWLGDTKWEVIHFNFGLHDIKHVDPESGKNSNEMQDPRQAEPKQYKRNLQQIIKKLKATSAQLIFATTTPYPENVGGPLRLYGDAENYNKIALKIMKKNNIAVDDLYSFVLPKMNEIMRPNNVHFTDKGSEALGDQVSKSIIEYL